MFFFAVLSYCAILIADRVPASYADRTERYRLRTGIRLPLRQKTGPADSKQQKG